MKRFLWTVVIVALFGFLAVRMFTGMQYKPASVRAAGSTSIPTNAPTDTPIPTETIGYQDTAIVAQQTALEAVRVNAQITAEYEQRIQEQLNITAEAERRNFEMWGWTQTAAPTSIALTSTAQLILFGNQTMQAGQMTATAQAPTLIVAMAQSESRVKHVQTDYIISSIGVLSVAFCMLALGLFLLKKTVTMKSAARIADELIDSQEDTPAGIDLTLRDETTPEKSEHYRFPCSQEQLTELAEMVVNGERTFGYNRMETTSRTFRNQREALNATRQVLEKAHLAVNTHNGESVINERGVRFFERWFDDHKLPDEFGIAEEAPSPIVENVSKEPPPPS